LADCLTKGGRRRCHIRTDDAVLREPAGFKVAVLFFVPASFNTSLFALFVFITSWRHNVADCTCLSSVALQLLLSQCDRCTRQLANEHRRQGISRLDEPLSASQECVLQQAALFVYRAIAMFVCQPLGRTTSLYTTEKPNVDSNLRVNTLSWYNKQIWSAAWSVKRRNLYRRVRKLHNWYVHLQVVCIFHATKAS
jgi:hypothetical protein